MSDARPRRPTDSQVDDDGFNRPPTFDEAITSLRARVASASRPDLPAVTPHAAARHPGIIAMLSVLGVVGFATWRLSEAPRDERPLAAVATPAVAKSAVVIAAVPAPEPVVASPAPGGINESLSLAERKELRRRLMRAAAEQQATLVIELGRQLALEHDWEAHLAFARALEQTGAVAEAATAYQGFLERNEDNRYAAEAHLALGSIEARRGNVEAARQHLEQAAAVPRLRANAQARLRQLADTASRL